MTDQQTKPAPIVEFKRNLSRLKDAGELDMLPANVSFEAFRNAAVVAITDNPAILQCATESIFKSIRRLAAAGLVPDGREAAIVPFKGQAQAMPMVYGLIKVARNSGEISSIWAEVVRGDETFHIKMLDGERKFEHEYDPLDRKGDVKGAYAVAKLKDGTIEVEAMGRADIEKRRRSSANQRETTPTGIWAQWYEEMAKKTVIRALVKRLPMSSDDMRRVMVEHDETIVKDVTRPAHDRPNLAQRLAAKPAATESALESEVIDGTAETPAEVRTTLSDAEIERDGFPGSQAFDHGVSAFEDGKPEEDCPYDLSEARQEALDWHLGYRQAARARQ